MTKIIVGVVTTTNKNNDSSSRLGTIPTIILIFCQTPIASTLKALNVIRIIINMITATNTMVTIIF